MRKQRQTGRRSKETSDLGTPEISLRRVVKVESASLRLGAVRLRVLNSCELDRLLAGEWIEADYHTAGLKLGWDISRAGGCRSCFGSLEGGLSRGGTTGGRVAYAVFRIAKAMQQVESRTNRKTARLVFSIASDETKITSRAELSNLVSGLRVLSGHYAARTSAPLSLV
jgi:predicted DNA-binding ribbon-helix-helix protein